ncbi:MAG: recombinase family protein [Bacteroidota bacterium]
MEKIAVGYLRCSTDMQKDSTAQQQIEVQCWADANGFRIVHWYRDEAQSGTTFLKRPAFVDMLKTARSHEGDFKNILVYDESRWGRAQDLRENSYWKSVFLYECNIQVIIIKTNSDTGNRFTDRIVEFIESSQASDYSQKQSDNTLRGCKDNAAKGFSSGGIAPYGYKRIAINKATRQFTRELLQGEHIHEDEKSIWALGDPEEVKIVQRIFDRKIRGMGDVGIANILNTEGVPPPKRGRWKNKDQKWAGGTIRVILTNPTYYGARVYNRHPQSHLKGEGKLLWMNPKSDWIVVENSHLPIITKETFELANKERKDYKRKNNHFYESPYLLSGILKCSHCGFNFHGQNYGKKNVRYYEDAGYVSKGKAVCSSFRINKIKIESFVIRAIRTKILNSGLPQALEEMLNDKRNNMSQGRLISLEYLTIELAEIENRINRLIKLAENGLKFDKQVEKLKKAEKEKKEIEKQIEETKVANLTPKEIIEARAEVQYLMDNFEEMLKTSPLFVQKELLRKFIHSIVVDRESDSVFVHLKRIPSLSKGFGDNSTDVFGMVKVEKKLERKTKKQKQQPTEIVTEQQPIVQEESVLTEN